MTTARHRRPSGRLRSVVAVTICVAAAVPLVPSDMAGAAATGVTKSVTATRTHLVDGADQAVDSRTVTMHVDETANLRDRQEITVSWTGAHPTGGTVSDTNSHDAAYQEYPVVLMECRGLDGSGVATAKRLTPETCWTQTPDERAQEDQFIYPSFRMDRYATAADRAMQVGVPSPLPSTCRISGAQHWVPFRGADGKVYRGGPKDGCAGIAPEAVAYEGQLQPGNTTYAATAADGTGSTNFVISTSDTNASLGCSATVACSLVVIPIEGISCDAAGVGMPAADRPDANGTDLADVSAKCATDGVYKPGEQSFGVPNPDSLPVAGALWWSPSNWRNRIVVPLSFARTQSLCDLLSSAPPTYIYGSELMSQATGQWAPAFCTDKSLFRLQHVHTAEPEALNLLRAGSIEAAFIARPPQPALPRPAVIAPTAMTGFSISYRIDDASGYAYHSLKLTPRLLAKLLTQSYPSAPSVKGEVSYLADNPLDMSQDPEFRALNPGLPAPGYNTQPAATLSILSADSDVIAALTDYIISDPDARAWLEGKPDPWGMVVNPAYNITKGEVSLPTPTWPELDLSEPPTLYRPDINPCLAASPVPFLPLVAAPVSSLAAVALNLQFSIAASQVVCANAGQLNQKLVAIGRERPGQRFILGLTTLADSERYQLDEAALETHVDGATGAKFTDATGRTFVQPSPLSLRAAAGLLTPDRAAGTYTFPYAQLRSAAGAAGAYPGTMLVSTVVPTSGLSARDAHRYSQFLQFAVDRGQVSGFGNGQLPPGYLPLTASDGMSVERAYTTAAAAAVAAQGGYVPSVTNPQPPSVASNPLTTSSGAGSGSNAGSAAGGTGSGATGGGAPPVPHAPGVGSGGVGGPATGQPRSVQPVVLTASTKAPAGLLALPVMLLIALTAGVVVGVLHLGRLGRRQ